jgi:hypothetical protein
MKEIKHNLGYQTCSIYFGDGHQVKVKLDNLTVSTKYYTDNEEDARKFAEILYYYPGNLLKDPLSRPF